MTSGRLSTRQPTDERHVRNFRRGARLISVAGRSAMRFVGTPVPPETVAALQQPCIVASNHRSVVDVVAGIYVMGQLGHTARVVSAAWLWEDRRRARLLDSIGALPLESGRGAVRTVERAIECLQAGEHLLMTPEGRVVPPEERVNGVGDGHKIISKIACGADVPIVPSALVGTDDVWALGDARPSFRPWSRPTVAFGFGPPVRFADTSHRENANTTMASIADVVAKIDLALAQRA